MNTSVSLCKRITVDGKSRFVPVALNPSGSIKVDAVLIDGVVTSHSGLYYLDCRINGKRVRKSVGRDFHKALDALSKLQAARTAHAEGVPVPLGDLVAGTPAGTPGTGKGKGQLVESIAGYLAEIQSTRKPATHKAYRLALEYFMRSCDKPAVSKVDRSDLLAYVVHLRDVEGLAARTQHNLFAAVISFLKAQGRERLVKKNDWPSFVEQEPVVYEPEELEKLWTVCTPSERLLFRFFLHTGFRDQEVQYVTWKDVNVTARTISVTHKPQYGWSPKVYRERSVPVPAAFVAELVAAKPKGAKPGDLLFPSAEDAGKPNGHFLRKLKEVTGREGSGLDPDDYFLHKFRSTFCTHCLQAGASAGVDLRTVQHWAGHTDLQSTMRYLKPARGASVMAKVEAIWA